MYLKIAQILVISLMYNLIYQILESKLLYIKILLSEYPLGIKNGNQFTQTSLKVDRQNNTYGKYGNDGHVHHQVTLEHEILDCILPTLCQDVFIAATSTIIQPYFSILYYNSSGYMFRTVYSHLEESVCYSSALHVYDSYFNQN